MVSSWQARLPGNSLSNPVITQLPLPNLASQHLLLQGGGSGVGLEGEVSEVFFNSCYPHCHLCQSPSHPLPSSTVRLMRTRTFSLKFWVDGIGGDTGGRGRREE